MDRFGDINEELGGFPKVGRAVGWQITHTVSAQAIPGARVSRNALEHIMGLICDGPRVHRDTLDAILLSLHIALVPVFCEDA